MEMVLLKTGFLYTLITAILFVLLEPISKLIAGIVNPFAITLWRFVLGSLLLLPLSIVKIRQKKRSLRWKDLGVMTGLGILFICISMTALQMGVQKADSPSLIAIIFSANSVFTIVFAILILKEQLNRYKILALCLGVIGVLICADFSSGTNWASILLGVLAAVSFSLYTILSQKFTKKYGGIVQTGIVFTIGSFLLLIVLLCTGVNITPTFSLKTGGILCFLGFFVTGIGYACYFKAMEKGGPIMASLAFFIKPILSPFVVLVINGIWPDFKTFISVGCIVAASYFATYRRGAQLASLQMNEEATKKA